MNCEYQIANIVVIRLLILSSFVILHFTDNIAIVSRPVFVEFFEKFLDISINQKCLNLRIDRHFSRIVVIGPMSILWTQKVESLC